MKKFFSFVAIVATAMSLNAQITSFGIGITPPQAVLHVHQTQYEEVEQEGVDLGEMNRLLMEKVEELTLYIIDLHKQINELKSNK